MNPSRLNPLPVDHRPESAGLPNKEKEAVRNSERDVAIQQGLQLIPYIGPAIAAAYFGQKQARQFHRLETFYEELRNEISGHADKIADLSEHDPDELRSILDDLHDQVETEHLQSKREYYKMYFKSTVEEPINGNYEERKLYLDTLAALTPLQLEILAELVRHGGMAPVAEISSPHHATSVVRGGIERLKAYGLLDSQVDSLSFARGVGGAGSLNESVRPSTFGRLFHDFCLNDS